MNIKEKIAKGILAPYLKGNRKLLAFLVYVGAVCGIAYFGKMEGFEADTALQWGFGFFVGGNVGEHAANGKKKAPPAEEKDAPKAGSENGFCKLAQMFVALLVIAAIAIAFAPKANAEILPYIDKLDLQVGPGVEIVDFDPFTIEEVLLGTAKVYERYKFELRVGGLLSDSRRALVFNVARNVTDLILRDDGGIDKSLLPTIGLWAAGDLVSSDDGRKTFEFAWGFNAVLAEY